MTDWLGNLMRGAVDKSSGRVEDPTDEFEAVARRLGCVDVATLRTLAPDAAGLAGVALRTKLRAELVTRPYLTSDEGATVERFHPWGGNLDGGVRGFAEPEPKPATMGDHLRAGMEEKREARSERIGYQRARRLSRGD